MASFVFDECFDDKRVVRACNEQAKCVAERYPAHLKGKKDHQMLPELLLGESPLVTIDNTIVEENFRHIPESNAGIIIVYLLTPTEPVTSKLAASLLSKFKILYPGWHDECWRGICLEVTEADVGMCSIPAFDAGKIVRISYQQENFAHLLQSSLEAMRSNQIKACIIPVLEQGL